MKRNGRARTVSWLHLVGLFFFFSNSVLAAKSVTYFYTDSNGNVLATTDASGSLITADDYHSSGAIALGQGLAGASFAGHYRDGETDLFYMQARYYDSDISRFTSLDPVKPRPGDLFNFNRQSYANNNPYRYVDPDGRQVFGSAEVANGKYMSPEESSYFLESTLCGCDPDWRPPPGSGAVQTVVTPFEFGVARAAVRSADLALNVTRAIVPAEEAQLTRVLVERGATRNSPGQVRTSVSPLSAQKNLTANGFARTTSKDGSVVMMSKDGTKYTFYDKASSTGGASASVQVDGQVVVKIRFNEKLD
ncbi:RHS repeat-associated protein [Luteibacter sp. W1I16]|uniref:RHS repeat-associated core domain-containing protein n=1 Tax=Luteibacter sp. W1I16 TaxID=3373922 RepID=UPI003D1D7790